MYAEDQQTYSNYKENNPKRQGQFLEEITGESDTDDILAQIAVDFSRKFFGFLAEGNKHPTLL